MHVFRTLAELRYGPTIAALSEPLYTSDWKALMLDDNKRGAMPTIPGPFLCKWLYNSTTRHSCCIIRCIKWVRFAQELCIYIEARGDSDLRHPETSCIVHCHPYSSTSSTPTHVMGATRFVAESPATSHSFKGYLVFDDPIVGTIHSAMQIPSSSGMNPPLNICRLSLYYNITSRAERTIRRGSEGWNEYR
jgi:hypothetical protein